MAISVVCQLEELIKLDDPIMAPLRSRSIHERYFVMMW